MRKLKLTESLHLAYKFFSSRRAMNRFPLQSLDHIKTWQLKRITQLVTHAYNDVPFYRRIYNNVGFQPGDLKSFDDFSRLPVVTKDDIIDAYPHDIISQKYNIDDLIVSRSSGSSGKALDIAYDSEAMVTYILAGLRMYGMGFSYRPWHKQAYIYTSEYPLNSLFGLWKMHFISTLADQSKVIKQLDSLKPQLLVCYPSHLKQLGQLATESMRKSMDIRCISVNSEMSTQAERDYLSKLFSCPVLDEYSSEELTRISAQCLEKNYHIFEDINYMETLDDQLLPTHESGTLIGTNLHNFAMPMIRYKQNDRGRISESQCSCGWNFRHLCDFTGRKNDSFLLPSGKELSSGFLLDATYEILLTWRDEVKDFCLIQEKIDLIRLQIVPGTGFNDSIKEGIRNRFQSFLEENVCLLVDEVQECQKTASGKRNPIICRIPREVSPNKS